MAQTQVTVPVRDGYDFGIGADLLSGAAMNQSVNGGAAVTSIEHAKGITVNFEVQRIQTTHDLEEALGIDAEASYGIPYFGEVFSDLFNFEKKSQDSVKFPVHDRHRHRQTSRSINRCARPDCGGEQGR
jgi:hypothetical protein